MAVIRRRQTVFVDFHKNDILHPNSDGSIDISGNNARHLRLVVPEFLPDSTQSDIQVSFYKSPSAYSYKLVPFKQPREPGLHISWGPSTTPSSVSKFLAQLGFDIDAESLSSAAVTTDNYHTLYYNYNNLELSSSGLLESKIDNLVEATSVSITYGRKPLSALEHQKETDLVVEAYWDTWTPSNLHVPASTDKEKVELGLFEVAEVSDPSHMILSGITKTVGKSKDKFDKTIINYSPKFRSHPGLRYSVQFSEPIGLHPKQLVTFDGDLLSPERNCKCYAKYTIPRDLFLDKYQLRSPSFLNRNTVSLVDIWGETDLENPVWLTNGWGSEAIFEVQLPKYNSEINHFQVEVPMHLRYKEPSNNDTYADSLVPWPVVFWACKDYENDPSPDIKYTNYESLFPQDTIFYYAVPEENSSLELVVTTPIAPAQAYSHIQWLTVIVVLSGVVYLVCRILGASKRLSKKKKIQGAHKNK